MYTNYIGQMFGFIAILIFLLGFVFIFMKHKQTYTVAKEGFSLIPLSDCPDTLIQKEGKFILSNSNAPEEEGVNPIIFDHLEEYEEYVEWLRYKGKECPILYLREVEGVQGDKELRVMDEINYPSLGPRTQFEHALNDAGNYKGLYQGFDQQNQYIGVYTKLDSKFHEQEANKVSDNAMDNNWGGVAYSRGQIDLGKYGENKLNRRKRAEFSELLHNSLMDNEVQQVNQAKDAVTNEEMVETKEA